MSTCACRHRRAHGSSASGRATLEEANALDVDHRLLKAVDLCEKADAVRERYAGFCHVTCRGALIACDFACPRRWQRRCAVGVEFRPG